MGEWLTSVRNRLRVLVRHRTQEQDLQDEIAHHLALREADLRENGTTDPAWQTRRRFGNVAKVQEDMRETWVVAPRLSTLVQDLRYAGRALRRSPTFTAVVVVTLGLGIGANAAFFSVVNAALLRPLGYADADRLVSLSEAFPDSHIDRMPFSALDFEDLQRYQSTFEGVAAYRSVTFELSDTGVPAQVHGAKVSAHLFPTLGVTPIAGRAFTTDEDRPNVRVAVLSWRLWQERFAGNAAAVGQSIRLDRQAYTIVGVMPATFVFPRRGPQVNNEPADVWVPIAFAERDKVERGSMYVNSVVARLKPGITVASATGQLDAIAAQIAANYPPVVRNAGFTPRLTVRPLREDIGGRFEAPLLMLLGGVGLVLLIACTNVANLMLSRAVVRQREFALRTALGARRARLMQLLLCEAMLLSLAGGVLGVALAYWGVRIVPAALAKSVPGLQDVTLDLRVLAFTAGASLLTGLLFALIPFITIGGARPWDALRDDSSRTTGGRTGLRMQKSFVVSAVGLAFVLLVGAGLFLRSFSALLAIDRGFRPAQIVTVALTLPQTAYTTGASIGTFHRSLLDALSAVPGVRSATIASDLPFTSLESRRFEPRASSASAGTTPMTNLTWVRGPYFETFGARLREGRFFTEDEHTNDRHVVIVNERLAARFWPGESAMGKSLKWGNAASQYPWLTVVGVVENVADGPIDEEPGVHAYEPFRQLPQFFLGRRVTAAVLGHGDVRVLPGRIREAVARLDPQLAIERVEPLDRQINDVFAPRRFATQAVAGFAAAALLLAWIGLYGLLAYMITSRRREIAVRLAVGAEPGVVARMVLAQGGRLVAVGVGAGLVISFGLTRLLRSLLYQTGAYDLTTFLAVPVVVAIAALLACAVPAWRASRVEPLQALRAE